MSLLSLNKFVVFAVIFTLCNVLHSSELSIGDLAPNWILQDKDGAMVSLYQQTDEGHTTVMFFWASWCSMCKDLIPELNKIKQTLDEKSVAIYFLNVWENKSAKSLKDEKSDWPVLMRADSVAKRYGIATTPAAIVVGSDKLIKYRNAAVRDTAMFIKEMKSLLYLENEDAEPSARDLDQADSSSLKSSNRSNGSTSSPSN